MTFKLWTVEDGIQHRSGASGKLHVWCLCNCGKRQLVNAGNLTRGKTSSCGCHTLATRIARIQAVNQAQREGAVLHPCYRHGHAKRITPEYRSWKAMWTRCTNPRRKDWKRYSKIEVADRWRSFELFLEDLGPRPTGTTLERKKSSLGYVPGNVCWATPTAQARNTSRNVINEVGAILIRQLYLRGRRVVDLAAAFGVGKHVIENVAYGRTWVHPLVTLTV